MNNLSLRYFYFAVVGLLCSIPMTGCRSASRQKVAKSEVSSPSTAKVEAVEASGADQGSDKAMEEPVSKVKNKASLTDKASGKMKGKKLDAGKKDSGTKLSSDKPIKNKHPRAKNSNKKPREPLPTEGKGIAENGPSEISSDTDTPPIQTAIVCPSGENCEQLGSESVVSDGTYGSRLWVYLGYKQPNVSMNDYVKSNAQVGIEYGKSIAVSKDSVSWVFAGSLRYAKYSGSFTPQGSRDDSKSKASLSEWDYMLASGIAKKIGAATFLQFDGLLGFAERSFLTKSGVNYIGDDFIANTGVIYGARLGVVGPNFSENLALRTSIHVTSGSRMPGGPLKHNGESLNLIGRSFGMGFELGWKL
ncbi:MAG: hypothetical protein NT027_16640 [Proteobacteria bacterium]|nr:hypothetical protein [Pseudomonadota bacterium]